MWRRVKNFFVSLKNSSEMILVTLPTLITKVHELWSNMSLEIPFSYLEKDEQAIYDKSMLFLHDKRNYVNKCITISYDNNDFLTAGKCVGYGSIINNVYNESEDTTHSTTRVFVMLSGDESEAKMFVIEQNMKVEVLNENKIARR